jgi:hypothetical protein
MKRMMMVALLATACTPVSPLPAPPLRGKCSADGLGNLVGRVATLGLVNRARARSGASAARVLRPGQIVTMEFREGRLNVNVDESNRVKNFTCG